MIMLATSTRRNSDYSDKRLFSDFPALVGGLAESPSAKEVSVFGEGSFQKADLLESLETLLTSPCC